MNERFGNWKGYIEAPKWAGALKCLYDLSFQFDCDLNILEHKKTFLQEFIVFKFSGYESNLNNVQHALNEILQEYNEEPFVSKKYEVKNVVFDFTANIPLKISINTSRFSKVKKMIQEAAEHYNVPILISEEAKGIFNKKLVTEVNSSISKKSIQKFQKAIENHLSTNNIVIIEDSNKLKSKKM